MYLEQNGAFRTDSLFYERLQTRHRKKGIKPVYSLNERVTPEGAKSLYQLFISCADEYDFAIKAFGSKQHLEKLKDVSWFMNGEVKGCLSFRGYSAWLEDMQERDFSMAKAVLIEKARDGDVGAAKKLYDVSKPSNPNTKGRPKKEDIAKAAAQQVEDHQDLEEDIKRLTLVRG